MLPLMVAFNGLFEILRHDLKIKLGFEEYVFVGNLDEELSQHNVPLDMKGSICHFAKWQIHPFISKGTIRS